MVCGVLQSVIIDNGLECSAVRYSRGVFGIEIIWMYLVSNKSPQYLGRACNYYCRINKLNPHHATNSFMLLKQSSGNQWTQKMNKNDTIFEHEVIWK